MKKKVDLLKKVGIKVAAISIGPACWPFLTYQPKPPAKIQKEMLESK